MTRDLNIMTSTDHITADQTWSFHLQDPKKRLKHHKIIEFF